MMLRTTILKAVVTAALAVGLLILFGGWIDRWPLRFDRALLAGLRRPDDMAVPIGPANLLAFMRDMTALGDGNILTLVVLAVTGFLLVQRKRLTAVLVAAATVSGSTLGAWAKLYTARARPDVVPHLVDVSSLSFPSAHAANSAIIYLTIAAVVSQAIVGRGARTYMIACAVLLVTLIGVSRIYLGVHWPSDVLAGWSFGVLWACSWWWAGARMHDRMPTEG